jgi:hypothetical protein
MENEKTGSPRAVANHPRRAIAIAALIAALAATGSTSVLADKGGRGRHLGVPDPSAPGASALTPSHGATPPGHLAAPGLRLGGGHSDGLALGRHNETGKGKAQAFSRASAAAMDRIAATTDGSNQEPSQSREVMPRQLPTCR